MASPRYPLDRKLVAAVVEDDRLVRAHLRTGLEAEGFDVIEGDNGPAGLRLAQEKPDIMVLDLNLPMISGLAVCRAVSSSIPIVFLTASHDERTVVSCLEAGAVDYVQKPFPMAVLIARVNGIVRARLAEVAERARTAELESAYRALREARAETVLQHRQTGLFRLADGLAHEMNSPLAALIASLQFAQEEEDPAERAAAVDDAIAASKRLAVLVRRMCAIGGDTERVIVPVDVFARAAQVAAAFEHLAAVRVAGASAIVDGCDVELREVLSALVDNAVQASREQTAPEIAVTVEDLRTGVAVTVDDNGPGVKDADLPFVFDPFFTKKRRWMQSGLGLSVAQAAAHRHGGEISLEGHGPLGGARARLWLPRGSDVTEDHSVLPILAELKGVV